MAASNAARGLGIFGVGVGIAALIAKRQRGSAPVRSSITVRKPAAEVEAAWLDFRRLGTARFSPAPGDRGTEVHVVGEGSESELADGLRRFKQILETGEVVVSEGSPRGHELGQHLKQRPARPVEEVSA